MSQTSPPLLAPELPDAETLRVAVLKVFDGDGFLARLPLSGSKDGPEIACRLGFIDAPEMQQPGGQEARAFLDALIGGKVVDIVPLIKMDTGGIIDRHGRIVCVPYLTEQIPGRQHAHLTRNIELELVLNGWAWVLNRYGPAEHYGDALEEARHHRRGIWAREDNIHPWTFKKQRYRSKRPAPMTLRQRDLFTPDNVTVPCPSPGCRGNLLQRSGKYGPFYGCSNYPVCSFAASATDKSATQIGNRASQSRLGRKGLEAD